MQSFRYVASREKKVTVFLLIPVLSGENSDVKFCSAFLTCARKLFMVNIVFPKVYMIPFLAMVIINFPHDMQG